MTNAKMNKVFYKISVAVLIAIVVANFLVSIAFACTPPPVTPWFSEQLSFVETNLPITVTHTSELTFVNTKASSFYGQFNNETKDLQTQISFCLEIYEEFDMILVNDNIFSDFEHHNKIGDNRPNNVQPPDSQVVLIPITLDAKQYTVKLRITYGVSNSYISDSVETYNNSCKYYPLLPLPWFFSPAIIGGAILLVLVVLIVIRRSRLLNKFNDNRK